MVWTLVATIHFSPSTGEWFTDCLFIHGLFPQQEGSFCPFIYSLGNHGRMLHSFTPVTRIHSLHSCESWPLRFEPLRESQRRGLQIASGCAIEALSSADVFSSMFMWLRATLLTIRVSHLHSRERGEASQAHLSSFSGAPRWATTIHLWDQNELLWRRSASRFSLRFSGASTF